MLRLREVDDYAGRDELVLQVDGGERIGDRPALPPLIDIGLLPPAGSPRFSATADLVAQLGALGDQVATVAVCCNEAGVAQNRDVL